LAGNAVRAQQVDSKMKDTCYISTSTNINIAKKFATNDNIEGGYIYTLDKNKFKKFGVISHELPNLNLSHEFKITIRAKNCGDISTEVIISKEN